MSFFDGYQNVRHPYEDDKPERPAQRVSQTLRDWLPKEALDNPSPQLERLLDKEISADHSHHGAILSWPGRHQHVNNWCEVGGYAVGWNENPSRGWSFPVVKMRSGR